MNVKRRRLEGIITGRPRTGPQTVHFDLANACNTRCTTCWHHSPHLLAAHVPSALWKKQQLALDRFQAVLDDLVALGGLEAVILSGMGDPTLNEELYAMVAYARQAGVHVTIITNGLRLDVARLLDAVGPSYRDDLDLLFSVCGVSPAAWQAFHAHPRGDGHQQMLMRLAELRASGFRPKHVQVINTHNVHELAAMVDFAHDQQAKLVSFKLASLAHGTEAVALDAAQREQLAGDWLPAAMARATALDVATDLSAFACQVAAMRGDPAALRTAPIEDIGCFMGFLYARVTVEGELLFCCNTRVDVGHLAAGGFAEQWHGAAWQARRDSVRAGRYFAGCEQCGKLKQNLKWSDKLRGALGEERFLPLIGRAP